jgi:hypothetical protein
MPVFTGMTDIQFALRRWISTISESDIKPLHMRPDYRPNEQNVCCARHDAILSKSIR